MREVDRLTIERYATPSLLLMETAANASARAIVSRFSDDTSNLRTLILCGRGNNGGDGAALARILSLTGAPVEVVLFGRVEDTSGDARTNFEIARQLASAALETGSTTRLTFTECTDEATWGAFQAALKEYDVIVDALFGTGLTRPLEGIYAKVVGHLAQIRDGRRGHSERRPFIVSLDLPSGLNADTAELIGDAVQADLTVTFTAPKPANVLPPASYANGELIVADIGSPAALVDDAASQLFLTEEGDARAWLEQTRYRPGSYKNTHGHALVIAGSRQMSGAAVLCGNAVMRSGAGLVTIATPASALPAVAARVMPEVMTAELAETIQAEQPGTNDADERNLGETAIEQALQLAARADALAIGPGLTSTEAVRRLVRAVVARRTAPVVVDADGLNALAPWPADLRSTHVAPLILTPHPGEMRRLTGVDAGQDSLANRVRTARDFAVAHQLILVLKGTRTLIAAPDGRVAVNPTGNAGTGTAGAGDTLTGIITGFIAQSRGVFGDAADVYAATVAAVYVAGLASDLAAQELGMRAMVASDISRHLGAAIRALDPAGERPS
ncbi:MAG: ADP-dependent NAD(P)H-hydrate dehydratase / NAD(P)H-hydrate epimerase [Pyrinomonadaceae bacterium]|jgi:NAD(P)H-hydrate epimerase|nr:ADP-dependent NAD(P)H-hydrate dehydratase / NAD(P)H-hydrate epimerase [Pyrinomonadaceae bacterium]